MSGHDYSMWADYRQKQQAIDEMTAHGKKLFFMFMAIVRGLVCLLAVPPTVLLHHSFGVRYLSLPILVFTAGGLFFLPLFFGPQTAAGQSAQAFAVLNLVVAIGHMLMAAYRSRRGIR